MCRNMYWLINVMISGVVHEECEVVGKYVLVTDEKFQCFLGIEKILSSPLYIGPGTWENSDLSPLHRLWDFEKFRALPPI